MFRKIIASHPGMFDIGVAVMRSFAGMTLAIAHGYGKLPPDDQLVEIVRNLGFPVPIVFAWAAAIAEFFGGLFLAVGLFTRVAAFLIICTMLTAAFGQHANDPFYMREMGLLYAAIALPFLLGGAGRYSVDHYLR